MFNVMLNTFGLFGVRQSEPSVWINPYGPQPRQVRASTVRARRAKNKQAHRQRMRNKR